MKNQNLELLIVSPHGFCAGVTRAINIVKTALQKYPNKKIYVRHDIVHNERVIKTLQNQGVTFIQELNEIKDNEIEESVVIFSAHGVSEKVEQDAKTRNMIYIDATCPLVKRVHSRAQEYEKKDYQIILIGHKDHPETVGTRGRIKGDVSIISTLQEAKELKLSKEKPICYITQTTLSVNDTKEITNFLKQEYQNLEQTSSENICYATQNRQDAISSVVNDVDGLIVVGSQKSSNSKRLCEIGVKCSTSSMLINNAQDITESWLKGKQKIAISAGASAPEDLFNEVVNRIKELANTTVKNHIHVEENVEFFLPKQLRK